MLNDKAKHYKFILTFNCRVKKRLDPDTDRECESGSRSMKIDQNLDLDMDPH